MVKIKNHVEKLNLVLQTCTIIQAIKYVVFIGILKKI